MSVTYLTTQFALGTLSEYVSSMIKIKREKAVLAPLIAKSADKLRTFQYELSESGLNNLEESMLDLYTAVKPPIMRGTLSECAKLIDKELEAAQTLDKLLVPMEASLRTVKNSSDAERSAFNEYISLTKTAYTETKTHHIDVIGRLRNFEEKYAGTAIAANVRVTRNSLPHGTDPAVLNYFEAIYSKVQASPPQFSPASNSKLDSKTKWRVSRDRNKHKITAKYGLVSPAVRLNCIYVKGNNPKLENKKGAYTINCVIKSGPSAELENLVNNFSDIGSALYFYDAKDKKLHYNKNSVLAELFSGYFDLNKNVLPTYCSSLNFILSKTSDKNKILGLLGTDRTKFLMKKGVLLNDGMRNDLLAYCPSLLEFVT